MIDYTPNEPIEVSYLSFINWDGMGFMATLTFSTIDAIVAYHDRDLAMVRVDDAWFEVSA